MNSHAPGDQQKSSVAVSQRVRFVLVHSTRAETPTPGNTRGPQRRQNVTLEGYEEIRGVCSVTNVLIIISAG